MLHYLFRNRLNPSSSRAREDIREGNILMIIALVGLLIMAIFFVIYLDNKLHLIKRVTGASATFTESRSSAPMQESTESMPTYKDTLPLVFLGHWGGTTRVLHSDVGDVAAGQSVRAAVRFFHRKNGLTGMMIEQPGWQSLRHSIVRIRDREVIITRTSNFISEEAEGSLTAVSRDHYKAASNKRLLCDSRVQLYKNGESQGFYTTFTELLRE